MEKTRKRVGKVLIVVFVSGLLILVCTAIYVRQMTSRSPINVAQPFFVIDAVDPATVKEINHVFTIKNVSSKSLTIEKVYTSCSCSTAKVKPLLKPNSSTEVSVTIRVAAANRGLQEKTVILFFKEKSVPPVQLLVRVSYKPSFDYEPQVIDFGETTAGSTTKKVISLTASVNNVDGTFQILNASTSDSSILTVSQMHDDSNTVITEHLSKMLSIEAVLKPEQNILPKSSANIYIRTNSKTSPLVTIPVSFQVISPQRFIPETLFFGYTPKMTQVTKKTIFIDDSNTSIKNITTNSSEFHIDTIEYNEKKCIVTISFRGSMEEGRHTGILSVTDQHSSKFTTELAVVID